MAIYYPKATNINFYTKVKINLTYSFPASSLIDAAPIEICLLHVLMESPLATSQFVAGRGAGTGDRRAGLRQCGIRYLPYKAYLMVVRFLQRIMPIEGDGMGHLSH